MPLYFFHLNFGQRVVPDEEGVELLSRSAARDEALAVVRELVNPEVAGSRRRWAGWFVEVADEMGKRTLRIFLRYTPDRRSVITDLQRVSRPGSRRYTGKTGIRPVVGGMGIVILSTPRGIMTGQAARKEGLGGELLCEVW